MNKPELEARVAELEERNALLEDTIAHVEMQALQTELSLRRALDEYLIGDLQREREARVALENHLKSAREAPE